MDLLTLLLAKKYTDEKGGESTEELEKEISLVDLDKDTAVKLLLNAFRQHEWQNEADAPICEQGTVTLTNNGKFPFNDSQQTVALTKPQKNTKYAIIADIKSASGNPGEVVASDKQVNGFKLAFTGSGTSAVVEYIVIGGIIK
jgi:hypothetical protein